MFSYFNSLLFLSLFCIFKRILTLRCTSHPPPSPPPPFPPHSHSLACGYFCFKLSQVWGFFAFDIHCLSLVRKSPITFQSLCHAPPCIPAPRPAPPRPHSWW
uniref:Secreted protein n=1 Tax=Mus musculus TaxID=10090 RepID=Q8BR19_MOUSE|nr:unnamed protein product [Mus musculus]